VYAFFGGSSGFFLGEAFLFYIIFKTGDEVFLKKLLTSWMFRPVFDHSSQHTGEFPHFQNIDHRCFR
jgi:hypothetical protein